MYQISIVDRQEIQKVLDRFKEPKSREEIFYNLCFVVCAPQTTYASNMTVIADLRRRDFYRNQIPLETLTQVVRPVRFLKKAEYLQSVKFNFSMASFVIDNEMYDPEMVRDELVRIVKGLGYKTASHFLRNLGATDLAIVDTHTLKVLERESPKNPKEYFEMEKRLREIAQEHGLSVAAFDVFIWKVYSGTAWEDYVY